MPLQSARLLFSVNHGGSKTVPFDSTGVAFLLNRDLLTVYDINTLLGFGLANTIQVVNSGIIVFCILNNNDSGRFTLYYMIEVFPTIC